MCVTTSGPAVLNAATALGQSYSDSIPVLLVAAGMPLRAPGLGNGELHETKNLVGALDGVVAYAHRVTSVAEIPVAVAQAFAAHGDRPPAPGRDRGPARPPGRGGHVQAVVAAPPPVLAPAPAAVDAAAAFLARARRPAILAGGGASTAAVELRLVAERLGAPVVCSINGKGTMPEDHPLSVGARLRGRAVRELVDASDAVLVVGSELGPSDLWRGPLDLAGKAVRIDVDPAQAVTNAVPSSASIADAVLALGALLDELGAGAGFDPADRDAPGVERAAGCATRSARRSARRRTGGRTCSRHGRGARA